MNKLTKCWSELSSPRELRFTMIRYVVQGERWRQNKPTSKLELHKVTLGPLTGREISLRLSLCFLVLPRAALSWVICSSGPLWFAWLSWVKSGLSLPYPTSHQSQSPDSAACLAFDMVLPALSNLTSSCPDSVAGRGTPSRAWEWALVQVRNDLSKETHKLTKQETLLGRGAQAESSVCVCVKSPQSCLTLCDPMDCSLAGSSVHGILQARLLKWIAMPSSRGSPWPRDWTSLSYISCIGRRVLYH